MKRLFQEPLDSAALVITTSGLGMELTNAFVLGKFTEFLPWGYIGVWAALFVVFALRLAKENESSPPALSPLMALDLLALLSVLPFGFGINILILSMFRLFRLVSRFDKDGLGRANIFATVIREQKQELAVTLAISTIALLIIASLFFMIEAPYQGQSANIYTFFKCRLVYSSARMSS